MSVGVHAQYKLDFFGAVLWDAFGEVPYHVGSSLMQKSGWRDVDIRVLLPDEKWEAWGLGKPSEYGPKVEAIALAFSALGRELTGLPIDFNIQQQSWANEKEPNSRGALGVHRFMPREAVEVNQ